MSDKKELLKLDDQEFSIKFTEATVNFDSYNKVKAQVDSLVDAYSDYKVDTANFKSAKEARAKLNKYKKAVNHLKIQLADEATKSVKEFETQIKGLIAEVDTVVKPLDLQIKDLEKKATEERHKAILLKIDRMAKEAGVDPTKIAYQSRWDLKTARWSETESGINAQIEVLQHEQEALKENVQAIVDKADRLHINSGKYVESLKNGASLSSILRQLDIDHEDIVQEAKRQESRPDLTIKNGKAYDNETGESIGAVSVMYLETAKQTIKITGIKEQFLELFKYLKNAGFKIEKNIK